VSPRILPRKAKRLLVQFHDHAGATRTGWVRDLSATGLFIICEPLPEVGEVLFLTLHLPRGAVMNLTGKVVRHGRGSSALGGSAPLGFGFALDGDAVEHQKLVDAL
jgi:hypothetical protein